MCSVFQKKTFYIKITQIKIFINMDKKVPITRLGKFFGSEDYALDIEMGEEWLHGDMNFTCVLYKVDRYKTKTDDVYGETLTDGIKYLPPVEFKAFIQVMAPENKMLSKTNMGQMEPGNVRISVYQKHLDELGIDIELGDYIGYYETETRVRYYVVANDGRVVSDNKHTYAGYKPFYRTIQAAPVSQNEFRGL
jgi:hypothetical protein